MFVDADDPAYVYIRDTISRSLDRHGREVGRRESTKLLSALWQVDYEARFNHIAESHQGTCDWIFHTEPTKSWWAKPRGFLIVLGSPGSGKSVLAKHLVRQIPDALQPRATRVLYYFARFNDTCENLVASFLHQLSKEPGSRIEHAIKHFRTLAEEFIGSLDVLTGIFFDVIAQERATNFIAIIDSFDEWNPGERRKLLKLLSQLEDIPNLGCIVTSVTSRASDLLDLAERQYVTFDLRKSKSLHHDIKKFVSDSLQAPLATRYHGASFTTLEAVENLVVEHAEGLFMWAAYAVRDILRLLREGASLKEVFNNLNSLPSEPNLLYDNLVNKIENAGTPDDRSEFRQILSILAVQQESMHLLVLVEALHGLPPQTMSPVRIGDIDDDHVHRLEVKTSALDPLVIYNNNYLTLGHVTAREYLLHTERYDHSNFLPIDFYQANADLAQRCVAVIHRTLTAKAQHGDLEELGHGFTGYAAKHWMLHYKVGQELVDEELTELASGLFRTDESPVSRWLKLYEEATAETLPRREIFGSLFGGAYFGLTPVIKKALEVGCDIDAVDSDRKTPLH